MGHDDLCRLSRRQPFQPFRVHATDGRTFDIVGPGWVLVTRTTTYVGEPGELADWVDNEHIVSARPIDAELVR